jgi:hypothetical protein
MVRKALFTLLLAAIVSVPAASAAPPPFAPGPLTAEQAQAQHATITHGVAQHATPEQALAASKIPGSLTEIAPGLTLRQAVGLDPARRLAHRAVSTACWNYGDGMSWDFWPWDRHLNDSTYICGSGGVITYRSSHFSQSQTSCNPQGTYSYKLNGGAGETYVAWREGGNWSCASPLPWVSVYPNDWMDIYANGSGGYWVYESGGN